MKSYRFFIIFFVFFAPAFSLAQVVINEIMYDPTDADSSREWVEIYNSGAETVDISKWKFLENTSASNHGLTQIQGTTDLPAGGFAVIVIDSAKFLTDFPTFSGNILKASFSSLNNTSATVIIKNADLTTQDQVTYASSQGANGDGNSLQRTSSGWVSATPTPGQTNATVSSIPETPADNTASTTTDTTTDTQPSETTPTSSPSGMSAHSSYVSLSNSEQKVEFEISAGRNRLTTVGNNLVFRATATKAQNISEQNTFYYWSFGDGTIAIGKNVNHIYKFPGEYSVVVNANNSDRQAVSRIQVKVIVPDVSVGRVDSGTEITNNAKAEINLEGWQLVSPKKTFVFPTDTLIPASKKIIFGDEVTGVSDDMLRLLNPVGREVGSVKNMAVEIKPVVAIQSEVNIDEIRAKIESLKNEINKITGIKEIVEDKVVQTQLIATAPKFEIETATSTLVEKSVPTEKPSSQAKYFEAPKETGLVSRVFAIPIKGFNFVRRLFVEE